MADIKQAVNWMGEGRRVISHLGYHAMIKDGVVIVPDCDPWEPFAFTKDELLSDDWEIADGKV